MYAGSHFGEGAMNQDIYRIDEQQARGAALGKLYMEFLRVPSMSAGVYALKAGATDAQSPHKEDEIYYVVRGRGRFRITDAAGAREHAVGPGDVLFVAARVAHQFFDITEDIELLVFFAPAETE
jgi:mannose-6-phosphate isomerase-like protein (cupin superfamily)